MQGPGIHHSSDMVLANLLHALLPYRRYMPQSSTFICKTHSGGDSRWGTYQVEGKCRQGIG